MKEIKSNCCCFSGTAIEVHVPVKDCPIKRELGQRNFKSIFGGYQIHDVTCVYTSPFSDGVPACEHFQGIDTRKEKRKRSYFVQCGYKEG